MSSTDTINISSLNMVHDELIATIEQAAVSLEQFAQDGDNADLLQSCIDAIQQIRGTLNLIQLRGVNLLADEILQHITDITLGENIANHSQLDQVTTSFFILPRYLEYCTQTGQGIPSLLLPTINELRSLRGQKALPESYYSDIKPTHCPSKEITLADDALALVRRLRHMYQTGLLNVVKDVQTLPSMKIMVRALERVGGLIPDTPLASFFLLAKLVLIRLQNNELPLTRTRKLLFSAVDREIKRFQFEGGQVVNRKQDETLEKELLHLLQISHSSDQEVRNYLRSRGLDYAQFSEADLQREIELLRGPSSKTVSSMVSVLREEINNLKNSLERAALGGAELLAESPEFLDSLKNMAEILKVVGLSAPAEGLQDEIERIVGWQTSQQPVSRDELTSIADTLLYVESTISNLEQAALSDGKVAEINTMSRDKAMSNSQLYEAEKIVIEEIEAGLVLVKRGLSSFIESNFDKGHINNLQGTLDSVRGGMLVLGLSRAAKIVAACLAFVENELLTGEPHPSITHQLETYADAIIGLEYYMDAVKLDRQADTSILQIAEESVSALGYAA
ncbi:MAG: pilus assembly protein [Cellvibrio sp.]